MAVGPSVVLPSLPALQQNSPFMKLVNEELGGTPLFLLDLEGSRKAALPPLYLGESGASTEGAEVFYKRLYQALDELQQLSSTDEEGDAKLFFSALPDYCSGQDFAKKCLASVQPSWWRRMLNFWTLLQVSATKKKIHRSFF